VHAWRRNGILARAGRAAALFAACALALAQRAPAQYSFDPTAADELDKPGVHYFGAARDEAGRYVPAATIVLETITTSYTLVTNEQGRFRARLPLDATPDVVKASCSKPGYQVLRISKRPGPKSGKAPVQVDCLLRRQIAG
jgi:hypothetical protein